MLTRFSKNIIIVIMIPGSWGRKLKTEQKQKSRAKEIIANHNRDIFFKLSFVAIHRNSKDAGKRKWGKGWSLSKSSAQWSMFRLNFFLSQRGRCKKREGEASAQKLNVIP